MRGDECLGKERGAIVGGTWLKKTYDFLMGSGIEMPPWWATFVWQWVEMAEIWERMEFRDEVCL